MIPVTDLARAQVSIRPELDAAIAAVLDRAWFILGPEVEAFEAEFAAYLSVRHVVGVGNGTDAITLSLRALGIGPGDEVITTAFTAAPSIGGIVAAGAVPVFVDVDLLRRTLDPAAAAAAITPRTRAIMPVHLYGMPAHMAALRELAARHGLALIEDAAQAHGARFDGRMVGSLGDIACFSFYPTKNLGALGDGGAIATDDAAVADRLRSLRNLGQSARYQHDEHATHSRLDELQAALLRVKLRHLDRWTVERRGIAARYGLELSLSSDRAAPSLGPSPAGAGAGCLDQRTATHEHSSDRDHSQFGTPPPLRGSGVGGGGGWGRVPSPILPAEPTGVTCCWHQYVVETEDGGRERFRKRLRDAGVNTDVHYPTPVHLQLGYARFGEGAGSLPVSERLARTVVSLPMFPGLTEDEQQRVIIAVRRATTETSLSTSHSR